MNLGAILKEKQSKENRDAIIKYVGSSQEKMEELMSFFFSDDLRTCQNASWPMTYLAEKYQHLIHPYLKQMNENLNHPHHDAVIRNTVRVWQFLDIPEELQGPIYERCFEYLADYDRPVAVRAFSVAVLYNITLKFPDLKHELIELMEDVYPHGSSGLKNRLKKAILNLKKIKP